MLIDRRGEELNSWLHTAFHCGIPELRPFVMKLRQDQEVVQAGLVPKWNNGMVKEHVNRLKFLKRSMYGRVHFDLLQLRVLRHRSVHELVSGVLSIIFLVLLNLPHSLSVFLPLRKDLYPLYKIR